MSIRTFGIATLTGLVLLSSLAAANPAAAHEWNSGNRSHRSDRDGRRDSRDGWYDNYGTYHRYERGSHSRRS